MYCCRVLLYEVSPCGVQLLAKPELLCSGDAEHEARPLFFRHYYYNNFSLSKVPMKFPQRTNIRAWPLQQKKQHTTLRHEASVWCWSGGYLIRRGRTFLGSSPIDKQEGTFTAGERSKSLITCCCSSYRVTLSIINKQDEDSARTPGVLDCAGCRRVEIAV